MKACSSTLDALGLAAAMLAAAMLAGLFGLAAIAGTIWSIARPGTSSAAIVCC